MPRLVEAEPIVAWRGWTAGTLKGRQSLVRAGGPARNGVPYAGGAVWLRSVAYFQVWHHGAKASATTEGSFRLLGEWQGMHSFKQLTDLEAFKRTLQYASPGAMWVVGRVSLWGHVVEHEWGYRAQHAYPYELWTRDGLDLSGYGVDVVQGWPW